MFFEYTRLTGNVLMGQKVFPTRQNVGGCSYGGGVITYACKYKFI